MWHTERERGHETGREERPYGGHSSGPLGLSPMGDPLRHWGIRPHICHPEGEEVHPSLTGACSEAQTLRISVCPCTGLSTCLWPGKGPRQGPRKLQEL